MDRVSRDRPCPICNKSDWCLAAKDGSAAICPRIADGAVSRAGDAGWLHVLGDSRQPEILPPTSRPPARHRHDWPARAKALTADCNEQLERLAEELGVSAAILEALGVGYDSRTCTWSFPERDGSGLVTGINARHASGEKRRLFGSRAGLTYVDHWHLCAGPVLLPEGASDAAALLTIGCCAVGRPSNNSGVPLLAELLKGVPRDREIIVLAERDQKEDGSWPGREGAIATATRLAESLDRPVAWSLPPDEAKDARAWLNAMPKLPRERLFDLFLTGLHAHLVQPPYVIAVPCPCGASKTLADWRFEMFELRKSSLEGDGVYLDRSPTGCGKSAVDTRLLIHCLQEPEAA